MHCFSRSVSFLYSVEQYERGLVMGVDWLMATRHFRAKNGFATTSHDQYNLNWIVRIQGVLIPERGILPVTNLERISGWVGTP